MFFCILFILYLFSYSLASSYGTEEIEQTPSSDFDPVLDFNDDEPEYERKKTGRRKIDKHFAHGFHNKTHHIIQNQIDVSEKLKSIGQKMKNAREQLKKSTKKLRLLQRGGHQIY